MKAYVSKYVCLALSFILLLSSMVGCRSSSAGNGVLIESTPVLVTNPTIPSTATTQPTEESTEATQPTEESTEATQETTATNPTVVIAIPRGEYIVPTEYPEISTREMIFEAPKLPIPAEDAPEEEWIAFFYGLIYPYENWYNSALTSFFEAPKDISMFQLFALGSVYDPELTDEENKFLIESGCYKPNFGMCSFAKISPAEMDSILQIYLGVSMEQTNKTDLEKFYYYQPTDSYYSYTAYWGAVNEVLGIVSYSRLENGDHVVRYGSSYAEFMGSPIGEAVAVLRQVGDHFQIISNTLVM